SSGLGGRYWWKTTSHDQTPLSPCGRSTVRDSNTTDFSRISFSCGLSMDDALTARPPSTAARAGDGGVQCFGAHVAHSMKCSSSHISTIHLIDTRPTPPPVR